MTPKPQDLNDADLRATIEGEVLGVVSSYGGERIVAGPPMYELVQELAGLVLSWRTSAGKTPAEACAHEPEGREIAMGPAGEAAGQ